MTLEQAMGNCKVRGYIAREDSKMKHWKNTLNFDTLPGRISFVDRLALDWMTYDPEGEATSIVG